MATKRTTHRSSKGTKLYAVRGKKGEFKDIQSYKRAHGQDVKRKSKKRNRLLPHRERPDLARIQAGSFAQRFPVRCSRRGRGRLDSDAPRRFVMKNCMHGDELRAVWACVMLIRVDRFCRSRGNRVPFPRAP